MANIVASIENAATNSSQHLIVFKTKRLPFHFATLHSNEHLAIFADDAPKQAFLAALTETKARFKLTIAGYAILDNHVHVLYGAPEEHSQTAILNHLRGSFTRLWRQARRILDNTPFWGHLVEVREVLGNSSLRAHLDYIHYDAVHHGLVERAADYPWSSLPERIAQGHYPPDWARMAAPASTWRLARACSTRPPLQPQH